jgi:hypothetical protein
MYGLTVACLGVAGVTLALVDVLYTVLFPASGPRILLVCLETSTLLRTSLDLGRASGSGRTPLVYDWPGELLAPSQPPQGERRPREAACERPGPG